MLPSHGRYRYSAIVRRPDYDWPDGRRLAFYVGLNLEHFAFGEGLGAELAPGGPPPDVLNFAWRDYGNRVGAWRLLALLDGLGLPCSGAGQQRAVRPRPRAGGGVPGPRRRDRRPRADQRRAAGRAGGGRGAGADRGGDRDDRTARGPPAGGLARPLDLARAT